MVETVSFSIWQIWVQIQPLLAVWSQANHFISFRLPFLISKMGPYLYLTCGLFIELPETMHRKEWPEIKQLSQDQTASKWQIQDKKLCLLTPKSVVLANVLFKKSLGNFLFFFIYLLLSSVGERVFRTMDIVWADNPFCGWAVEPSYFSWATLTRQWSLMIWDVLHVLLQWGARDLFIHPFIHPPTHPRITLNTWHMLDASDTIGNKMDTANACPRETVLLSPPQAPWNRGGQFYDGK